MHVWVHSQSLVACFHDSLNIGLNVWKSHSCSRWFRAGSPQCYSSCQLSFPSLTSSPYFSTAVDVLGVFSSRSALVSIAPNGSERRRIQRKKGTEDPNGFGWVRCLQGGDVPAFTYFTVTLVTLVYLIYGHLQWHFFLNINYIFELKHHEINLKQMITKVTY